MHIFYSAVLSRLYYYVECDFLVLNSQPVCNIVLHLDSWHIISPLSAQFQQSHERYSQELTHNKMYPERTNQIRNTCWGIHWSNRSALLEEIIEALAARALLDFRSCLSLKPLLLMFSLKSDWHSPGWNRMHSLRVKSRCWKASLTVFIL